MHTLCTCLSSQIWVFCGQGRAEALSLHKGDQSQLVMPNIQSISSSQSNLRLQKHVRTFAKSSVQKYTYVSVLTLASANTVKMAGRSVLECLLQLEPIAVAIEDKIFSVIVTYRHKYVRIYEMMWGTCCDHYSFDNEH